MWENLNLVDNFHSRRTQNVSRKQIPTYIANGYGSLRQAYFSDKIKRRLNNTVKTDDLGMLVYQIARFMELLTTKLAESAQSDQVFADNCFLCLL